MTTERKARFAITAALLVCLLVAGYFIGRGSGQNANQLLANQVENQNQRLARQNVTIRNLGSAEAASAKSIDKLSGQLAKRGSISQHVLCGEDRIVFYTAALTGYINAIVKSSPDEAQRELAFLGATKKVTDGLTAGSADACPALPTS